MELIKKRKDKRLKCYKIIRYCISCKKKFFITNNKTASHYCAACHAKLFPARTKFLSKSKKK
ncbi:hypothetical protein JXA85_07025 [Candidatus Woesearchaeota archaeon]|nr:hypothetical protein [Candidatus Woesearchaeota archaeon]